MRPSLPSLFSLALLAPCGRASPGSGVRHLPECGLGCLATEVPKSPCKIFTNMTCICANQDLQPPLQACIKSSCSATDAINMAHFQAESCGLPKRSRRPDLLAPLSVEIPACITVLARLYSRWYTSMRWEIDDWIMCLVAILFFAFLPIGQYVGLLCFGVDIWNVDLDKLTQGLKLFYVAESLYLSILLLTKVAILFFYLRIFPNPRFRRATFAVMAWVTASGLVFLLLQVFQCRPVPGAWEFWRRPDPAPRCLDVNALAYTAAGFSIAQDAVVLALPVPLLLRLHADWRVRCGVLTMFGLGVFVLITSCARLRSLVRIARSENPSWDYTDCLIWTGLEVSTSIVVNSLPAIRVLFKRIGPSLWGAKIKRFRRLPSTTPSFGSRAGAAPPAHAKSSGGSSGTSGKTAQTQTTTTPDLERQQGHRGAFPEPAVRKGGDELELGGNTT